MILRNFLRETRNVSRETRREVVTYFWAVLYNCDSQWFGYQSMFICTHSCSKSWLISHLITDFYNFIPVSVYSLEVVLIVNICQTLKTAYLSIEINNNNNNNIYTGGVLTLSGFRNGPVKNIIKT